MIAEYPPLSQSSTEPVGSLRFVARLIPASLGLLLIAAAGLKLYGLHVSPVPSVGTLASPRLGVIIAVWELILGYWLLTQYDRFAGIMALLTFACFSLFSAYFGILGVTSCGCFGTIQASPWLAFCVDIVAITLLVVTCPMPSPDHLISKAKSRIVSAIAIVCALCLIGWLSLGSWESLFAMLNREPFGISPAVVNFGEGKPNEILSASVTLSNYSSASLHVIGGTSDCTCNATYDLPLEIPPNQSRMIKLKMRVPQGQAGQLTRTISLISSSEHASRIVLTVTCHVTP